MIEIIVAVIIGVALWLSAREIRLGMTRVAPEPIRLPGAAKREEQAVVKAQAIAANHRVVNGKPYRRPTQAFEGTIAETEWFWAIDIDQQRATGMVAPEDLALADEILSRA